MNDADRIDCLQQMFRNCPTAKVHFNDDPDVEFSEGGLIPVGFTIRIEGVEEPIRVTAPTFREAVDLFARKLREGSRG